MIYLGDEVSGEPSQETKGTCKEEIVELAWSVGLAAFTEEYYGYVGISAVEPPRDVAGRHRNGVSAVDDQDFLLWAVW